MGLDWFPQRMRAREGCESEYLRLVEEYEVEDRDLTQVHIPYLREQVQMAPSLEEQERWKVSMSCFEAVGAPQIGFNEEASGYFRKEHGLWQSRLDHAPGSLSDEQRGFWGRSFEECLEDVRGLYVLAWARDLKRVESYEDLGHRMGPLRFIKGFPKELQEKCYEELSASEALELADQIERYFPGMVFEYSEQRDMVRGGIEWLRFWGVRNFGVKPSF